MCWAPVSHGLYMTARRAGNKTDLDPKIMLAKYLALLEVKIPMSAVFSCVTICCSAEGDFSSWQRSENPVAVADPPRLWCSDSPEVSCPSPACHPPGTEGKVFRGGCRPRAALQDCGSCDESRSLL